MTISIPRFNITMSGDARLLYAFSLLQLVLHVVQCAGSGDQRLWPPHAVAFLHDLLLLGAVFLGGRALRRLLPRKFDGAVKILSITVLFVVGALLSVYPPLLRDYLSFPVNLFNASPGSISVLLTEYIGIVRLWPVVAAVALGAIALKLAFRTLNCPRTICTFWIIVVILGLITLPRTPHPWVHSIQQSVIAIAASKGRSVPSLEHPTRNLQAKGSVRDPITIPELMTADHIFVIVLEGVTASAFEKEFLSSASGYYASVRDHALYFRRYYATNLDSYTSLIAMLTAIQVPYRSYVDEGLYAEVNNASNLTRALRNYGFFTAFVSTYEHQPFVPTRNDWDLILDRKSLPSLDEWVSLGTSRMEAATEDRAALATIIDLACANEKTFILHEMVYGHSTEWRATTGQTQLSYYDQYLRELTGYLTQNGLIDRSLLVVVSDHGDRAKPSDAENYRVPLLIIGSQISPAEDTSLRSHLDLPAILTSLLSQQNLSPGRISQFLVGSTERWVYGQVKANGAHLFIDDPTGTVMESDGTLNASTVRNEFQKMLNEFGSEFGQMSN